MLELLVRWVTRRNFALVVGLFAALMLASQLQDYPRSWYRAWRYPAADVAPPAVSSELLQEKERRESAAVQKRYVALMVRLEQARQEGFDVSALEEAARAVLPLNRPGFRDAAVRKLNEIELAVPRKKSRYIPMATANDDDLDPEDIPRDVPPGPSSSSRRDSPSKRRRRR